MTRRPATGTGLKSLQVQPPVNLATVADDRDCDHAGTVVYRVDDPIVPDPGPKPCPVALQRCHIRGSRLACQVIDSDGDGLTNRRIKLA